MKYIYFTPGPSQLWKHVPQYLKKAVKKDIPSISHRGDVFKKMYQSTTESIKTLLEIPSTYQIFFLSSGTEAMERIIANIVDKESFHFVNGSFSERLYKTALELGKGAVQEKEAFGKGFHFSEIKIPSTAELICFTQNETSSGVALQMTDIYSVAKANKDTLIALDIVSSAPYVKVDYSLIDCAFFSVQKGFGLPAGLGILIVSPKAIEKAKKLSEKKSIGSYHSFLSLLQYAEKQQTPETPNVLELFLLEKVIKDYIKIGLDKIRRDTEKKAEMLYAFFDSHRYLKPFIENKYDRSYTVLTVTTNGRSSEVIKKVQKQGYIVGEGYGKYADTQIRIANFPSISKGDVRGLLQAFKKIT